MSIKFTAGLTVGMALGAMVGMVVLPQLDRKTRRSFKRAGNRIMDIADDAYCMMDNMSMRR